MRERPEEIENQLRHMHTRDSYNNNATTMKQTELLRHNDVDTILSPHRLKIIPSLRQEIHRAARSNRRLSLVPLTQSHTRFMANYRGPHAQTFDKEKVFLTKIAWATSTKSQLTHQKQHLLTVLFTDQFSSAEPFASVRFSPSSSPHWGGRRGKANDARSSAERNKPRFVLAQTELLGLCCIE